MTQLRVKGLNGHWLDGCRPARSRQLITRNKAVMRKLPDGTPYLQLVAPVAEVRAVPDKGVTK